MNAKSAESMFAAPGARFTIVVAPGDWHEQDYVVDIRHVRRGEFFELPVPDSPETRSVTPILKPSSCRPGPAPQ